MEPTPAQVRFDPALKRLFDLAHDAFLALIVPGTMWLKALPSELPSSSRFADLVWEVLFRDGQRGLLHIELQTSVDSSIGERLAEYGVLLWRQHHMPVKSVVVYLRDSPSAPESPFVIDCEGEETLRYQYTTVRLSRIPQEQVLATENYGLYPLAGLLAGATVETVAFAAERILAAPLPHVERTELAGLLALLAGVRLPPKAVLEALRRIPMIDDLLRESGVAALWREESRKEGLQEGKREGLQEGKREGLQEGKREGLQEGKREGLQEGLREGKHLLMRLALEERFGVLSDDMLGALVAADDATLVAIVTHLAADTLLQTRQRLGLH